MTSSRFIPVDTQKTVPPGKIKAEVAIRFFDINCMMDRMHVWCYDHETEQPANIYKVCGYFHG